MALANDIRILANLPVFRELEPEALRLVAFSAETRILRTGEVLYRRGDRSDGGLLVLSGTIDLETLPGRTVTIKPPTLLGESALLTQTIRSATATVREPSSVLKIPRALYRKVLTEYPKSAVGIHRLVAARLAALREDYKRLSEYLA